MIRHISCFFVIVLVHTGLVSPVCGKVYIDIHSPASTQMPIIVAPFRHTGAAPAERRAARGMAQILSDDLAFSGVFRLLDPRALDDSYLQGLTRDKIRWDILSIIGAEAVVTGGIGYEDQSTLAAELRLFDAVQGTFITGKKYRAAPDEYPLIAHRFSNEIYKKITGESGVFSSRIAYVQSAGTAKEVTVMDYDGRNPVPVTRYGSLSLCPAWSPDGRSLAFTSYKDGNPDMYVMELNTGRARKVSHKKGINIAPSWSPDGQKIALTLSLSNGNSEIYILEHKSGRLERITRNWATDVSPSWSPDGQKIAFVSSRSGSPQIYIHDLKRGRVQRITYEGGYNTSPSWSPRGDFIAYAGLSGGKFNIHIISADGRYSKQLTFGSGNNEDPSWSPDGRYLAFSSNRSGRQQIYIMRFDGTGQKQVTHGHLTATDPAWSPL